MIFSTLYTLPIVLASAAMCAHVSNAINEYISKTINHINLIFLARETGKTISTYTHTGSNNATLSTATLNVKNIYSNTGKDTITGDANANWLGDGAGADSINAGAVDDVLLIDANDTSINGGSCSVFITANEGWRMLA